MIRGWFFLQDNKNSSSDNIGFPPLQPTVIFFYRYYSLHPERLWSSIMELNQPCALPQLLQADYFQPFQAARGRRDVPSGLYHQTPFQPLLQPYHYNSKTADVWRIYESLNDQPKLYEIGKINFHK